MMAPTHMGVNGCCGLVVVAASSILSGPQLMCVVNGMDTSTISPSFHRREGISKYEHG